MVEFAKNLEMRGNLTSGMDRISDMPRCRVIQTGAQSVNDSTNTAIVFDLPQIASLGAYDNDGFYNPSASRTQVVCRTAGLYGINAVVAFTGSAAGATRGAWLQKNGSTTLRYGMTAITVVAAIASNSILNIATQMPLNAGDYIELFCNQNSGGALSTTSQGGIAPDAEIMLTLLSTT